MKTEKGQHTPGPWRWIGDHSLVGDHGKRPAVISASRLRIRDDATGRLSDFDPDHPDARLLAAAPTLYAALEGIVDALESGNVAAAELIAKNAGRLALATAAGEKTA